jgi:hypothetical protein
MRAPQAKESFQFLKRKTALCHKPVQDWRKRIAGKTPRHLAIDFIAHPNHTLTFLAKDRNNTAPFNQLRDHDLWHVLHHLLFGSF